MHSMTLWKIARSPNYDTNIDKLFPYSEVPYLGEYHLIKIPLSLNNLIEHVDYWGEGKIVSGQGTSGFSNCYNVNYQYQLVSSGPDRDRKIPNRIPVPSDTSYDTSSYIKDNSVVTVTVMGSPIDSSCAKDLARMVNNDLGRVVAYGYKNDSKEIQILTTELEKKALFHCPGYTLPSELQGITLFKDHVAFLNLSTLKDEFYKNITNATHDNAVIISKNLNNENGRAVLSEVITKLISTHTRNIMAFAYKLWHGGAREIVRRYFPASINLIFNEEYVKIINKQYNQALKLDVHTDSYNDRLAWGDSSDKTSKRVSWKIIPVWDNNTLTFKLYNVDCNMYLKLDVNVDNIGDRKAWGSTNSDELRHRYYVEPFLKYNSLMFYIINCQYHQGLKLAVSADSYGDRLLWGHNGTVYDSNERYWWIIAPW